MEKLPVRERIELKDIVYHYPNSDVLIFDHAQMTIPVGSSVGVVGTSGAGKTTIIDILLGLLHIQEGQILADGVEVREHYEGWLKNIGYIPQTIFMIDSSIRKNVAFGVPDEEIDDEKVWQALKEAQLDEFVRGLPEGLDTSIGERGIRISGGQRQRIGIARALFEDPEVLVLDEATSRWTTRRRRPSWIPSTICTEKRRWSSSPTGPADYREVRHGLPVEDGQIRRNGRQRRGRRNCPAGAAGRGAGVGQGSGPGDRRFGLRKKGKEDGMGSGGKRQANYELLRILAMLMVVVMHFFPIRERCLRQERGGFRGRGRSSACSWNPSAS